MFLVPFFFSPLVCLSLNTLLSISARMDACHLLDDLLLSYKFLSEGQRVKEGFSVDSCSASFCQGDHFSSSTGKNAILTEF